MPSAVKPNPLVTKIPTSAAITVVPNKMPRTEPPILPSAATSRMRTTAAIIMTNTSGIMIMRKRLT